MYIDYQMVNTVKSVPRRQQTVFVQSRFGDDMSVPVQRVGLTKVNRIEEEVRWMDFQMEMVNTVTTVNSSIREDVIARFGKGTPVETIVLLVGYMHRIRSVEGRVYAYYISDNRVTACYRRNSIREDGILAVHLSFIREGVALTQINGTLTAFGLVHNQMQCFDDTCGVVPNRTQFIIAFCVVRNAVPYERQVMVAYNGSSVGVDNLEYGEHHLMRVITLVTVVHSVCIGAGGLIVCAVEENRVAFEYSFLLTLEGNRYDVQVQFDNRVTTVSGNKRIAVFTLRVQVLSLELIVTVTTDCTINRRVFRLIDNQLQTVIHPYAVDIGRIVAIDTGGIERCYLTVPFVNPAVRQFVVAYRYNGIYSRVKDDFHYRRAVTSGRR